MAAKTIMVQGTGSNVGKSLIVAGLCRILKEQGLKVAPFKAQNMALNSYITYEGGEIGRAQALQAEAAGILPSVDMNPILLKPAGNMQSQVVVLGKPLGNMSAREYHNTWTLQAWKIVTDAFHRLANQYDVIVIEGAGSPAEINLKDTEIVNMRVAKYARSPVLLVGDIDRGGVLASLVGTMELLEPEERQLIKGFIINKFRGDVNLFLPAIEILERKTLVPVLGVLPYQKLALEEEDSMSIQSKPLPPNGLDIVVIRLPQISNFTDFDALKFEPDVGVRFESDPSAAGNPDAIIIPGSKNTISDLNFLRTSGWESYLKSAQTQGIPIVGICGGYQMLGEKIYDPLGVEGTKKFETGLGFIKMKTEFWPEKTTTISNGILTNKFFNLEEPGLDVKGYEIHMGQTILDPSETPFIKLDDNRTDGAITAHGQIWGTYFHGIFDNDQFRRNWLNYLRQRKNLLPITTLRNYKEWREYNLTQLGNLIKENLNMEYLMKLIENGIEG